MLQVTTRMGVSGVTRHVVTLLNGLNQAGYRCRLVTGSEGKREGSMKGAVSEEDLYMLPALQRAVDVRQDLSALLGMYRLMRRIQPHVVHTHAAKAGFIGRLAARLAGVPVVVHTMNGHYFHGYFGPLKTSVFKTLEWMGARLSDCVFTVSEQLRREIAEHGVAKTHEIELVPQGVHYLDELTDSPAKAGAFRESLGVDDDVTLFAAVGRLAAIKNLQLFLKAGERAAQADARIHLALVGDGPQRRELETFVEDRGLADHVTFTGWRDDIGSIYTDADAVVISSHNEGTPTSLIEAMAFECPVIATRVGGVPDIVSDGETGQLVAPGSTEALAEAMLAVSVDAARVRNMAVSAKRFVFDHYDARQLVARIDEVYQRLLKEKNIHR